MDNSQSNSTLKRDMNFAKPKKSDRKKDIYKNVLSFPQGTQHLKYFEKNPHPDVIPDESSALAQLFPKPDLNVSSFQQRQEFELVKRFLAPNLSDLDKKIMRMPDVMQQLADCFTDGDYKKAFTHLRNCFYNFFSTPLDDNIRPDIQWIDYSLAAGSSPVQNSLEKLKNNLFNAKAMDKLAEKLHEAGAFGDQRKDFYFWNTSPYNWSDISYQARSVKVLSWPFLKEIYKVDFLPQYIALGDFTINAIPEGYVQPKGNGKYDICVNKVYFFINDSFNFEDDEFLGYWDLNEGPEYSYLRNSASKNAFYNGDFRQFQRHGYGRYFPVLSPLHELENFQPVCKEYPFVK